MFQGVQSVALQMAQEFGFTREIEDRVQAPCPIWLVAASKVLSGSVQGVISAIIVLPIASVVHAAGVEAQINLHWWIILTVVPLVVRGHGLARSRARDQLRAAQHRADVRLRRPADHLPRRHLLPVDPAGPGGGGRLALAADDRAHQPADLRERGHARRLHQRRRTCTSTSSTPCWSASARSSSGSACATSAAASCPSPRAPRRRAVRPARRGDRRPAEVALGHQGHLEQERLAVVARQDLEPAREPVDRPAGCSQRTARSGCTGP